MTVNDLLMILEPSTCYRTEWFSQPWEQSHDLVCSLASCREVQLVSSVVTTYSFCSQAHSQLQYCSQIHSAVVTPLIFSQRWLSRLEIRLRTGRQLGDVI